MTIDSKEVYADHEFDQWASREDLEPGEIFLITKYLTPTSRTLEAGSGGGRLLLAMQAAGFSDLHGFDFLPEFVAAAKARDTSKNIKYCVQDATRLNYPDASFDQLVYLQQILCFIPTAEGRTSAVREATRILRPGGTLIVSLLSNRERKRSLLYRVVIAYLYALRTLTFRPRDMHYLPWLRLHGKVNWQALLDREPHIYWYDEREAVDLFRAAGLQIEAVGSDRQVADGRLLNSASDLEGASFRGRLYVVCRK